MKQTTACRAPPGSIERKNEMHNCKHAKAELTEAAFRGLISMPDGLSDCVHCREELASLRGALQITDDAMQSVKPREDFWPGYHARLRQHLETQTGLSDKSWPHLSTPSWRKLFTASVPVPAPLAFAAFAFIIFALAFMWHARTPARTMPLQSVVTKTVEVPVVQEKVVTRVVYRDRRIAASQLAKNFKAPHRDETNQVAAGLAGFTPANEPKLTIIKASYRDEK
jgi:hypothetical protein